LGLAHAKEFAALAKGDLTLTSKLGSGTRVNLILPAAEPPATPTMIFCMGYYTIFPFLEGRVDLLIS
jgi:hypothetical protein